MRTNIGRVGTEHCFSPFSTALSGGTSARQPMPSLMLNAEVNRAKLTAYVSCPFVVLMLVVIAFVV